MENVINITNKNIKEQEVKIINLIREKNFLFIELNNGRKFLTNNEIVQEFSEYSYFINIFKMENHNYVLLSKDYQHHLIDFKTKEIIISFNEYYTCYKKSENILQINEKLFNLKTKEYIPNTENLKPKMFCCLSDNLFLFDTTEKDYLKRKTLIVNEKGEQLLNCDGAWPYLVDNYLLLSDIEKKTIKIIKYENGKFNKDQEIVIEKQESCPKYYKGKICVVKDNTIYIVAPNLKVIKQYPMPVQGTITSETIENNTLLMSVKIKENYKIIGVNLINGKYFEAEEIGIRPLDMVGPATKITIAKNNIIYNNHGIDICYDVTLLDEDFNELYKLEKVTNYDYIVCNKVDKIWLKQKEGGILYNVNLQKAIKTSYSDVHFQFNDKNTKIEYGFGLDEITGKLQIIDEEGNILINSVPYEELDFAPFFGEFGFYYLNTYACIIKSYMIFANNEIWINSIIDSNGNILYSKQNTIINTIGKYFQIKEKEKTIYFNTLTGEFTEKILIESNDIPLLEEQNTFEITEEGTIVLAQTLTK